MEEKSTYESYGYKGVLLDMAFKAYLQYNFVYQTDELAYVLFDQFYLTPWVKKSPYLKPIYNKQQCHDKLKETLLKITSKLKNKEYKVKDELKETINILTDMEGNNTCVFVHELVSEAKQALPRFLF